MKIVAVTPWVPTTRRPRARGLLKILSKSHDIHIICLAWGDDEEREAHEIDFATVDVLRASKLRALAGLGMALFTGQSLQQAYVSSTKIRKLIVERAEELSPDLLYFNVIRTAHLVRELKSLDAIRLLDMDETRSNYYDLLSKSSPSVFWRIIGRFEKRRMRRAEAVAREDYDAILVSSPIDQQESKQTFLVRSPVDESVYSNQNTFRHSIACNKVVFVGRLSYYANAEAIFWFADKVWPLVLKSQPNALLDIVGESPSAAIQSLASSSITVHGKVPEVASYYQSANVSVVPVRFATGAQMKLIESMIIGTPTVVTSIVQLGLGVIDGIHTNVPEGNEDAWSSAVISLLENSKLSTENSTNAMSWVEENYSESAIASTLERAIRNAKCDNKHLLSNRDETTSMEIE